MQKSEEAKRSIPLSALSTFLPAMHKRGEERKETRAQHPRNKEAQHQGKPIENAERRRRSSFRQLRNFFCALSWEGGRRLGCSLERAPHTAFPPPFLRRREKRSQQSGETKLTNDFTKTKTKEKEESVETEDRHYRVLLQDINQCHDNHLVSMVSSVSVSAVSVSVILFRAGPTARGGCQWQCVRETDRARGRGRRPRTGRAGSN